VDKLELEKEAWEATEMLKGKTVEIVRRHRENEMSIQFADGTRLFVNQTPTGVELSITNAEEGGAG